MAIAIYEEVGTGRKHWAESASPTTKALLATGAWVMFDSTPDTPPPASSADALGHEMAQRLAPGNPFGDAVRGAFGRVGRVSLREFGTVDMTGATDHTDLINDALAELYSIGGGLLELPPGVIWADGKIAPPVSGSTIPTAPPLGLIGAGQQWYGRPAGMPNGGSILRLTAESATGKIEARGLGILTIEDLAIDDPSGDASPFIYTTNTALHIDKVTFRGSKARAAADQDAIILGGTQPIEGQGDLNHGFQGYGTVISRSIFSQIRRGVVGRVYANAVVVRDNTWWIDCGNPTGGAIEWDGNPAANAGNPQTSGCLITGNLFEMIAYGYGVVVRNSNQMQVIANQCYDTTATSKAAVWFDNSQFNLLIDGFNNPGFLGLKETGTAVGTTTRIASSQSEPTRFPQPVYAYSTLAAISAAGQGLRSIAGSGDQGLLSVTKGANPYAEVQLLSTASAQVADGATTSGSFVVTSATAAWTAQHVGTPISGTGIPSGTLIASRESATSVTLTKAATATANGVTFNYQSFVATAVVQVGFNRGHLNAKGSTPTIAAGVAAGGTPTLAVSGADLAGSVTVTTGTSPTTGRLANITLAIPFGGTERPVISPANAAAAAVMAFADRINSTAWSIDVTVAPPAATVLKFNYWVPEAS